MTFENANRLLKEIQKLLNGFKSKMFLIRKETKGKGHLLDLAKRLKISTSKQMLQRLPIALAQVKGGDTSENLLNLSNNIFFVLSKRSY